MEQLTEKQIEKVARELCSLRGLDPEERISHPHPQHGTLLMHTPRYQLVIDEVKFYTQLMTAFCNVLDVEDGTEIS